MEIFPGATRLMLGTAQFGLAYGIVNDFGQVEEDAAFAILDRAGAAGIDLLDTAMAYGNAIDLLSRYKKRETAAKFRIVTKVSLGTRSPEAVLDNLRHSIDLLRGDVDAVLIHVPQELASRAGEQLWWRLIKLRDSGWCGRVGISAYPEDNPVTLAERFQPDLMQVPLNVLDQRLLENGSLERLAALNVAIHLRSIFLQGVILADPDRLPDQFAPLRPHLRWIRDGLQAIGHTPLQAALRFSLNLSGVEAVAIGVTGLGELAAILEAAAAALPEEFDWRALALNDTRLIDPRCW